MAWIILVALPAVQVHAARSTIQPATPAVRYLVMPFDAVSREPRIYWLAEASSVLLADDLNGLGVSAITRDERLHAFERLQVPPVASLSHATVIRIGHLVGATQVVVGSLELEGEHLAVRARSIRLDTGKLAAEIVERGPLAELFLTFERVARRLAPDSQVPAAEVEKGHPPIAAFEQYIKGLISETPATQVMFLETALRLAPSYDPARVALWKVHDDAGDHSRALDTVAAVPEHSRWHADARFLAALSRIELDQYDQAFAILQALAGRAPYAPVFNNLGIVQLRRGEGEAGPATSYFEKASQADPGDPDYFFNLGYAYWLQRDLQAAIQYLRETVRRRPADEDAHFVLGVALQATGSSAEAAREKELARQLSSTYADWERRPGAGGEIVPRDLERLKTELSSPSAQRLDTALVASEQREQRELADFHLERGRRLFQQENDREAVAELRRAVYLSPYQAEAHLLVGRIYLRTGRLREAIDELKISLWSEETVAAHLALAEAHLQAKDEEAARAEARRALTMDPASVEARKLLERLDPPRQL